MTYIGRCEPSLQPGSHHVIIAIVIRVTAEQHAERASFAKIDTTSLSCRSGCSSEPSIPVLGSPSIRSELR